MEFVFFMLVTTMWGVWALFKQPPRIATISVLPVKYKNGEGSSALSQSCAEPSGEGTDASLGTSSPLPEGGN